MLQRLIRNKTILAIASIVLGIWLIVSRSAALTLVIRILGYGLLGTAAAYLISYFMGGRQEEVQLGYGVLAAVAGLLVIWLAPAVVRLFPILAGLALILNGGVDLWHLLEEDKSFRPELVMPTVTVLLGLLVVFHPGAIAGFVVMLAGIAFVVNGLADLNVIRKFW